MADFSSTRSPRSHLSSRQRGRTACTRCKARKQRCDGQLPTCWNCAKSGAECDLNDIRSEDTGWVRYVGALENKVAELELQLAQSKQESQDRTPSVVQAPTPGPGMPSSIGDVLNFLALGSFEPPLVGSSSGLALALNLGDIVQASVWNKSLSGNADGDPHVDQTDSSIGAQSGGGGGAINPENLRTMSAGPPTEEEGSRFIDAYFVNLDARYPFLNQDQIRDFHHHREILSATDPLNLDPNQRFGLFKLYLVYAIGCGVLMATEMQMPILPEAYYMAALQHISAARESRSLDSIEAMTLLVIFHLRSPASPGLWYMIGLAMRTCVDLGLHSSRKEVEHGPATIQHRRKLFWSVYALERNIAISLGHPVSIPDRQIDADLPTTDSWSLSTCWASIRPSCLFSYQRRRSSVSKEEAFGI